MLGTAPQMMVCDGVWLYGELEEWRIHWWQRVEMGCPVAAAASWAAAGVRPAMVWAMSSKGGAVVSRVRLTEVR